MEEIHKTAATPSKEPTVTLQESHTVLSDDIGKSPTKPSSNAETAKIVMFLTIGPLLSTEKRAVKWSLTGYVHVSLLMRNWRNTFDYFK